MFPLLGQDALYVRWNGGGGWGDPLLRPEDEVCRDVREGLVSPGFAENVYGVVLDNATGQVNKAQTARNRAQIVARRKTGEGHAPVAHA